MPATTFVLLVATVLSVDGGVARIDCGCPAGLRPGDAGTFYYQLTVGPETRRVDVGTGTLIEAGEHHALVEIVGGAAVRPDHLVEFRIPIPPGFAEELLRRARGARPLSEPDSAGKAAGEAKPGTDAAVRAAVMEWAEAWSDQRIDDYLSFYASSFRPPGGMSHGDWESLRRQRISSPASITISLEQLEVVTVADRVAVATFIQSYRSDVYSDRVSKLLDLVREGGEWRILEERVVESGPGY